ncbi:MAG: hypothetical protein AB9Q22_08595 [Candidatus Reddybacter sp.]
MDVNEIAKQYISIAEEQFGSMCSDWNYKGVEFNDQGPHIRYYPDEKNLTISLNENVRGNEVGLHFQLAHEVCHLLYPTRCAVTSGFEKTTVLNEGISTYFSIYAVQQFGQEADVIQNLKEHNSNYYNALAQTCELLQKDDKAIIKLRSIQPMLNKITVSDFELAGIDIPEPLKLSLLDTFS